MTSNAAALAEQLLDAQVAWIMEQLTSDGLPALLERDLDDVLAMAGQSRLDAVVNAEDVSRVVRLLLAKVPTGVAASTLVQAGTDVIHDGPAEPVALDQLIAREHVDALVTEVLALHPALERGLDRVADSPLMGTLASRFVTKLVVEVLQANRSVAEKIPGMGGIVNFGTNAATKVIGAADKPLQQLVGGTAGKGAAFAMRRLNAMVVETVKDPTMHAAVMEVWDTHGGEALEGAEEVMTREQAQRIASLLHEMVIAAAPSEEVAGLADAFVKAFFDIYGEYPVTTLLEELEITRDDILAELTVVVPRLIATANAEGRLEGAIRDRLTPFFHSPQVAALLA